MQTSMNSDSAFNPAPMVPVFLFTLDRVTGAMGLNVPPVVDLDYLRSLPPHTLGKAWADALDDQGLVPLSTGARLKQIHDGIHVLTGYDVTPIGEAQVQLFLLGSKFRVRHGLLLLGLVVPIIRYLAHYRRMDQLSDVILELLKAFNRGRQSTFDILRWQPERTWQVPLQQVKTQLNVVER